MTLLRGQSILAIVLLCLVAGWPAAAGPPQSLAGQILIADPGMLDPRFEEAVIFVFQHDAQGAMGLVVNQPIGEMPLAKLWDGAKGEVTVYRGGPVQPALPMVLHSASIATSTTIRVNDKLAVTAQPDILRRTGSKALLTLGYAGWAPGQLEAELEAGFWAVAPAAEDLLFGADNDRKWERARASIPLEL